MKTKIAMLVAVVVLSGCAPRYQSPEEAAMNRAAMNGAAMSAALQNAHSAAFDGKSIGEGKHHHKHKQDNGVIYQDGVKGYYDANGDFIQYGQGAHKHIKQNASLKQLSNEAEAVINGTIGDGADFLISQGWKANKGAWHKQGYTLQLVVEDGIVKNAQLTK